MTLNAKATIETKKYDVAGRSGVVGDCQQATGAELFHGDLSGEATWEGLMVIDEQGVGSFVSFLRFEGALGNAAGSFVLRLAGETAADGTSEAAVTVVTGSATDGLSGLRGTGMLTTCPDGSTLSLDYDLG